jgi:hypothetical protein
MHELLVELDFEDIKGFVTCVFDRKWWAASVLDANTSTRLVKLSFLHPNGRC